MKITEGLYDPLTVKYMMDNCSECAKYSWENMRHMCDCDLGKHEIYFETVEVCAECGWFKPKRGGI